MDTLFRLVSFHQPQAAAAPYPSPDQQLQQQSPYSSRSSRSTTSTGSPSSTSHHIHNHYYSHSHSNNNNNHYYYPAAGSGVEGCYYLEQQQQHLAAAYQEGCCNDHRIYMDEDFSSSSSSRQQHVQSSSAQQPTHTQPPSSSSSPPVPTPTPPPSTSSTGGHGGLFEAADFSFPSVDIDLDFSSTHASPSAGTTWATQLLLECARAVAARDSQRVQQLMWMLNELASPYGDVDQKLASYFLQGLFARLTSSGTRTLRTLASASDRNTSFESTRRTALRFQELSPWASFGHVAANGAILESFLAAAAASSSSEQQQRLHILDLSNTFCTQWPTLLEALATRSSDETPHLSITTVVPAGAQRVMPEIAQRLEKFARLMGVPFAFRVVHHAGDLATLDLRALLLQDDDNLNTTAALAVNCVNALRGVAPAGRDAFLASVRRLDPRVVTVVEEEADLFVASMDSTTDTDSESEEDAFVKVFGEGLRFFSRARFSLSHRSFGFMHATPSFSLHLMCLAADQMLFREP
ncbi:hypothetical protein PR202_gb25870 [Eleusine coracana subsp. coracana]|uniref:Uncharacterized protein n=1 Tax=Eleusine coracana subsp. coracana TaxID=191504 RepID=A0AAV5FQ51_ELECO|nr:hypothetical protein PR202_gb25870 [Eleusine coracana subsp. coracana]